MNRRELLGTASLIGPLVTFRNEWGPEWDAAAQGKRLGERLVMISPQEIIEAFRGPHQVIAARLSGGPKLPADAKVRSVSFDYSRDVFVLRVQSAEWEPVPLGEVTPVLEEMARIQYEVIERHPDGSYSPRTSKI